MRTLGRELTEKSYDELFPNKFNNRVLVGIQLVVFFFVIVVSAVIGALVSNIIWWYVGGVIMAFIAYQAMNKWPWMAFSMLVVMNMVVRTPAVLGIVAFYINAGFLMVMVLTAIWIFQMVIVHRKLEIHAHRTVFAALALGIVATLSFVAGYLPWFPIEGAHVYVQLSALGIFIISVTAFLMGAHHLRSDKDLAVTVYIFLFAASILIIGTTIPSLSHTIASVYLPGARGSMTWTWVTALAFSQALANTKLKLPWRVLLFILVGILVYITGVLGRSWVSGWLPAFAALGVIVFFYFPRLRFFIVSFGLVAAVTIVRTPFWRELVAENSYSLYTRGATFAVIYEIVKVNPLLGLGPANYYWYTPLYTILGFYVQFNSHNQYVDLIAQTGLLGLAAFIWFAAEMVRAGLHGIRDFKPGFQQAYAYGVLGGVAGTVISGFLGDWVIPFFYNVGIRGTSSSIMGWFFMGGLVAIWAMNKREREAQEAASLPA